MAKASNQNRSDGEGRKLGEQSGLDIGLSGKYSCASDCSTDYWMRSGQEEAD
ncbi:hypothetical protein HYU14_06130 [Candidatus Woesearchaeota archaeon]|nr:hypothetical protein [Candidatus Woesearchaeota archaeon]